MSLPTKLADLYRTIPEYPADKSTTEPPSFIINNNDPEDMMVEPTAKIEDFEGHNTESPEHSGDNGTAVGMFVPDIQVTRASFDGSVTHI